MVFLLIDIGNTNFKWAFYQDQDTAKPASPILTSQLPTSAGFTALSGGESPCAAMSETKQYWSALPCPQHILVSNVGGPCSVNDLLRSLTAWPNHPKPHWVVAKTQQLGVRNHYVPTHSLGSDRWTALIGARAVLGKRHTLVVGLGTATTIDLLTEKGDFLGGSIVPGFRLMVKTLQKNTALLRTPPGTRSLFPRKTADAIASGCLAAQLGAVEHHYRQYLPAYPGLTCILSGGEAHAAAKYLSVPFQHYDHLVIRGLLEIALHQKFSSKARPILPTEHKRPLGEEAVRLRFSWG